MAIMGMGMAPFGGDRVTYVKVGELQDMILGVPAPDRQPGEQSGTDFRAILGHLGLHGDFFPLPTEIDPMDDRAEHGEVWTGLLKCSEDQILKVDIVTSYPAEWRRRLCMVIHYHPRAKLRAVLTGVDQAD